MTLTRFVLPGLVLGLVLSLTPSVAKAGVVFGNLGANGNTPDTAGFDGLTLSTAGRYAAAGFTINAPASYTTLKLNSVTLSLSGSTAANNVEIWTSTAVSGAAAKPNSLVTAGTVSAVASSVNNSLGGNLWTFGFGSDSQDGVQLSDNAAFWVVLKYPGSSTLTWQVQDPSGTPGVQNSSSYVAIADFARQSSNSGGAWSTPASANQLLGVSVNAVPEPSTYVMAGIGAGLAGLVQLRRRKR